MMGEEFYCSLKLVSGEEIFSLVSIDENDGDPLIILQNPIIIKIVNNQSGVVVKIKPWMEVPNDEIYIIKLDKVITMTEVKDNNMIFLYQRYLEEGDEEFNNNISNGKIKITGKMGYVSTVEDARKKLEDLYKNNKGS
jgi:hypothetical protein